MTNSFLNKVSAERNILTVVNARTSGRLQLTGLSNAAINLWRSKVGTEATKDVVEPLIALAELCQRLSDRSHETFMPIDASLSAQIGMHISALKQAVERMK